MMVNKNYNSQQLEGHSCLKKRRQTALAFYECAELQKDKNYQNIKCSRPFRSSKLPIELSFDSKLKR